MSYPYPQDRHRDRKEKGEQPYKDAREAMSQTEADIQAEAEAFGEANPRQTDEERMEQLSQRRQICCAGSARVENVPRRMTPAPGVETHNGTSSMPAASSSHPAYPIAA